jgi:hypothetical protein
MEAVLSLPKPVLSTVEGGSGRTGTGLASPFVLSVAAPAAESKHEGRLHIRRRLPFHATVTLSAEHGTSAASGFLHL